QQRAGFTQQYNEAIDRRSQLTAEMERRGMSPQMTEGLYRPIGGVESGRMPPEEVAQQLSQRLEGSSSVSPPPPSPEITMGPEDAARARDAETAATQGYLDKPLGEANPVG